MVSAPIAENEVQRLEALRSYQILDTKADPVFDDLAMLASHICGTPIALVSLVDSNRQWFKAKVGLQASETPRDISFCGHAITADDLFVVEDALADKRFADNPLVTSSPNIRFYAGAKLMTSDGYALGAFCVQDQVPRKLTPAQEDALRRLSRQAVALMEYKRNLIQMAEVIAERNQTAELKAAKQAAEAASRAKTEFLNNISHELLTPMNAIIGMTELVLDSELTPKQREDLLTLRTSAHSLLSLIESMLHLSEIESGQLELGTAEFSLRDTVDGLLSIMRPAAHEKGLSLVCRVQSDVPDLVTGNSKSLRQVMGQLVHNAIKFTERGQVTIDIEKEMLMQGGILAHCSVEDTGIGIPADKKDSIFDVFTQADGSLRRSYEGTGLGLTISSRLVEKMRGRIWVSSELGTGSKFHFTFYLGVRRGAPRPQIFSSKDVVNS